MRLGKQKEITVILSRVGTYKGYRENGNIHHHSIMGELRCLAGWSGMKGAHDMDCVACVDLVFGVLTLWIGVFVIL